jgi:uncharacterized protein with HEPN domain
MKNEFLDYVTDVVDAMSKAESFIEGMEYESFVNDDRTIFAVIRSLEIVGEAVKKIPETIRRQYPQISWKAMAGMRDKLIHGYDNVNLVLVWETAKIRIPMVKPIFQQIIEDHTHV